MKTINYKDFLEVFATLNFNYFDIRITENKTLHIYGKRYFSMRLPNTFRFEINENALSISTEIVWATIFFEVDFYHISTF